MRRFAKRLVRLVFCMALPVLLALSASAMSETDEGLLYSEKDGEICIEGYRVAGFTLKIPSEIEGKKVTSVAPSAFFGNENLTEIEFPDTVLEIGKGAMMNCAALKSVILPSSLAVIPENCFRGCQLLRTVTLPGELKRIEGGAFEGCVRLGELSVPASVEYIADYAFSGCESLILKAPDGSYAASFALSHGINTSESQTTAYLLRRIAVILALLLALWLIARTVLKKRGIHLRKPHR